MFKRISQLAQLVTYKELRNGLFGLSVVLGGLGLAFFTLYAHLIVESPRLAGIAAAASLVFVFLILVFVIPPLARNASAEASQLNLPFEFTVGGAIYIALSVIVAFAAWNTKNNLLFLVFSFLAAAMIISFLAGHFSLKRLDVKMRFPELVYVNEPTPIILSLHSRKRLLPTFSITAEVRGRRPQPEDLEAQLGDFLPSRWAARMAKPPLIKHTLDYFIHIPRLGEIENQLDHIFEKRGRFEILDFELSTKFPFALFRHRRRLPAQRAEIVVFPKHVDVAQDTLELPSESGNAISNKKGVGLDLVGMRRYQPLDDLRHIDWKATARTRKMIVRDFAAEDELRVLIVLDPRIVRTQDEIEMSIRTRLEKLQNGIEDGASESRINTAAGKACFLLDHYFEKGAEIGIFTPEVEMVPSERDHDFFNCMRSAAMILPEFVDSYQNSEFDERLEEFLDGLPDCHIFVVRASESGLGPDSPGGFRTVAF